MSDHLADSPMSFTRAGADGMQITFGGKPIHVVGADRGTMDRLAAASPAERQQILARLAGL